MNQTTYDPSDRRPLASRDRPIFQRMAGALARGGISPNTISMWSIVFAIVGAASLVATSYTEGIWTRLAWVAALAGIQLRLLMNMFDGMVAIESGKASRLGEIYNELPDRISDPLLLIGAGYAHGGDPRLGYVAAILALLVAYIRALGKNAGAGQVFLGPMAKPQRMFLLTVACLYCAATPVAWQTPLTELRWGPVSWVLAVIILGCVVTSIRRLRIIAQLLGENP